MTAKVRRPAAELHDLAARALVAAGTSAGTAELVAAALVAAEVDGQAGHGLSRVAGYAAQVRGGKIDGRAVPVVTDERPAAVTIDAANGFAYPAIELAISDLAPRARRTGIAAAAIRRSSHAGVLGRHVERLADAGLVALMVANTPPAMAPWGGRRALLGTNPIAFACPRPGAPAIVIDLALTEVARGRIVTAAARGEAIPLGWAVDGEGRPTTDPGAALAGALLPAGGPKGAALALMVEVLAAAIPGANLAVEATSFLDAKGRPPGTGQLVIAIDPHGFAGEGATLTTIARLAEVIEADGARLPGTRRLPARREAAAEGVAIDGGLYGSLCALAGV